MCVDCWREYGSHQIDNENVRKAAMHIYEIYEKVCPVGGPLHVQLDDWNIDYFGESIIEETCGWKYWKDDLTDEQKQICRSAYNFLREISFEERASALALYDGYWSLNVGAAG